MKAWFYALLRKLVYVVARTPTSGLRCALYRFFFKYQIIDTYIGYGTEIYVESFHCERARLGENNRFRGSMRVFISPDVTVASGNVFDCGDWAKDKDPAGTERYARTLIFSEGVKVSHDHFFDVVGHLEVGPHSWLAGRGSQFWTHGPGDKLRSIHIGANCYVGSAVRVAPGSRIGDRCLVGMGSVVSGEFADSDCLVGGVPAQVIRKEIDWSKLGRYGRHPH